MTVSESKPQIQYLNGLRGIAILLVLMVHVSQSVRGLPEWVGNLTFYGVRGVQLFFIVSGLTLTLAHKDRPLNLENFAARRFFRVAPMFYVGAALYLALAAYTELARFIPKDVAGYQVAETLLFVHGWSIDANNKIVPGGWSIAAEAMFYVVFPFLLARIQRSFLPLLIGVYALAGVTNLVLKHFLPGNAGQEFAFAFWLCHLPAFATGCWLALGKGSNSVSRSTARAIGLLSVCAILADSQLRGHSNLLVSIVLLSTFVWSVGKWRPGFLNSRVLTWIGEISFSLYILHFAVLSVLSFYLPQLGRMGWAFSFSLIYLMTLILGAALASFTFNYIEKPFIRIGRNMFTRQTPGAAAASLTRP